jgi:hypothetical protein
MAMLPVLKWQLDLMGQKVYLPPQLLVFVALGDSSLICLFLWRIWRIKRGAGRHTLGMKVSYVTDLAKILGGYAALNAIVCGIVFLAAKISFLQMIWAYFLFLIPGLLGVPAISRARQLTHNPKASALWFALAMGLFLPAAIFAGKYSGLDGWLGVPMDGGGAILTEVFGTVLAASSAYYSIYKSLSQRQLVDQSNLREHPPADSA